MRRARFDIESIPSFSPSWTATTFRDLASASRRVSGPRYCPSEFSGLYVVPLGRSIVSAESTKIVFGAMLSAMANAYTIGLNDEPGCLIPSTARSNCESL